MKTKVQAVHLTAAGKCEVQYDLLDDQDRPVKGGRLQYTSTVGVALLDEAAAYVEKLVGDATPDALAADMKRLEDLRAECCATEARLAALKAKEQAP